jgi:hypothetical protein
MRRALPPPGLVAVESSRSRHSHLPSLLSFPFPSLPSAAETVVTCSLDNSANARHQTPISLQLPQRPVYLLLHLVYILDAEAELGLQLALSALLPPSLPFPAALLPLGTQLLMLPHLAPLGPRRGSPVVAAEGHPLLLARELFLRRLPRSLPARLLQGAAGGLEGRFFLMPSQRNPRLP